MTSDHGFGSRDNKLYYSYVVNVIAVDLLPHSSVVFCPKPKPISSSSSQTMVTPTDAKCAACGKGGDGLKKCTACELVKYCGVDCQRAHRPKHKKACRRRAAELHDEALFRMPPSWEECPICFLELPFGASLQTYKSCCGKILCRGCSLVSAEQSDNDPCPFCRKPATRSNEERRKRLDRRIESNDPDAMAVLGIDYLPGTMGILGLQQDIDKALELLHRAAELGSIIAHYNLGGVYCHGNNGVEVDKKKAKYYWEIAAMAGNVRARHDLGAMEGKDGNRHQALKHWIISANAGCDISLKGVQSGYMMGLVSKDEFEKTLRAHQQSKDEMKSEWRDHAEAVV